ncbi:MAG: YhcH/YjgK/YiaL family protein [Candidatus Gastranaerophilales bacterium]|nr:YhcH/YjgK/YiaL family protein [Candidatus Gastranaerophilales bacterium]
MIFDRLNNSKQYFILGEKFKKAFDFLNNTDLKNIKEGRYEIDANEIYANVQGLTTKQKSEKKWEVHKDYIDIQYVIKGQEAMGYGILEDFEEVIPYNKEKDVAFLDTEKEYNYINVAEGEFVIFYPNDVHAPMLSVTDAQDIKKVIVKIKV